MEKTTTLNTVKTQQSTGTIPKLKQTPINETISIDGSNPVFGYQFQEKHQKDNSNLNQKTDSNIAKSVLDNVQIIIPEPPQPINWLSSCMLLVIFLIFNLSNYQFL